MTFTVKQPPHRGDDEEAEIDLIELVKVLAGRWKLLVFGPLAAGVCAFGISSLIPPTYTARTTLLPPQQQGGATAALSQLGALAGLAGATAGIKNPSDQYVAMLQSVTVADRIIGEFNLMAVYEASFREDARKTLSDKVSIAAGKKDGLITVEVDDHDPSRAAAMANAYVEGLRHVTSNLAVTEAQQRRVFFEQQLQRTKTDLANAQLALQASGINQGALKTEPQAAASSYARLLAEATAAEVQLHVLRGMVAESSPEFLQQRSTLAALRTQISRAEQREDVRGGSDYVAKYREFKYHEALFDLFARQYELARVDESREGMLIQVLDQATPPERKSKPRRASIAVLTMLAAGCSLGLFVLVRHRKWISSREIGEQ
jgi:uncharacterized protein involved in exopolysaccharide biosynthesis